MSDHFDLLSSDFRSEPFPLYERIRAEGDVLWNSRLGMWMVVGCDEARAVLSSHSRFRSGLSPNARSLFGAPSMIFSDPPAHVALRQHLAPFFAARRLAEREPSIREAARELVCSMVNGGSVDFVDAVAGPLPVIVISEMLGVPQHDRNRLRRLSDALVSVGTDGATTGPLRRAAARDLQGYFRDLLRDTSRMRTPLLDAIASQPGLGGDRIAEQVATCIMLLVAGHETTTNFLGNLVLALCDNDWLDRLRRQPDLRGPFMEEALRRDGPVHNLRRVASTDAVVGDTEIRSGAAVTVMLAAANRDPAVFSAAEELSVERQGQSRHLAFGAGIHYCLGAALARIEVAALLDALAGHVGELRLVERNVGYVASFFARGPRRLLVSTA